VQLELERFLSDMTRADFARAAAGRVNGAARAIISTDRPTIFFFPGMLGDVPASARFRARLAPQAMLAPLRYPDLAAVAGHPPTVEELGCAMADDIEELQPAGPVRLAGYSFGAAVAAETAQQLVDRGREIAFFGILDADISRTRPSPGAWLKRVAQRRRELPVYAYRNLIQAGLEAALRLHAAAALPQMLDRAPMSRRLRRSLVHEFEGQFRMRSLRAWAERRSRPIRAPAALFRSDEPRPGTPEDLGWRSRVQSLEIVPFSGAHSSCLGDEPFIGDNCERFLSALRRAGA
jgi:acetoacetyl-CoA synthetase